MTDWFDEIDSGVLPNAKVNMGWMKIAFAYAFYYLRKAGEEGVSPDLFVDTMRAILLEGGDTDTNAAIVGGLIGALVGLEGIPKSWRDKLIAYDGN